MKRILGLFLSLTVISCAFAMPQKTQTLTPKLVLVKLEALKVAESDGDEFYFDLSVAKSKQATRFLRIPEAPMHFPSQIVDQLKNVSLWTDTLEEGQQVTILLSLNEQDAAPLDPDDFIGAMQVTLKNVKGVIKVDWLTPSSEVKSEKLSEKGANFMKYVFKGDNGNYTAYFSVM